MAGGHGDIAAGRAGFRTWQFRTGTANAGNNLMGNPALEGFRFRLAAAQNECIQSRLIDNVYALLTTKGTN